MTEQCVITSYKHLLLPLSSVLLWIAGGWAGVLQYVSAVQVGPHFIPEGHQFDAQFWHIIKLQL